MARNSYFNQYSTTTEQNVIDDLIIESIKIYGIDVYYVPRVSVNEDELFGEDPLNSFEDAIELEMYVKSVDGFEGSGDFLSKFGLQIEDTVNLVVAKKRYEQETAGYALADITRPREGDLIWIPLTKNLFEIKFVEHEEMFYQLGSLYTFEMRCELFNYSSEKINTGIEAIDSIEDQYTLDVTQWNYQFALEDDSGNIIQEDDTTLLMEVETDNATIRNFDAEADNDFIDASVKTDNIIDFSEKNPFSEGYEY